MQQNKRVFPNFRRQEFLHEIRVKTSQRHQLSQEILRKQALILPINGLCLLLLINLLEFVQIIVVRVINPHKLLEVRVQNID